MNLTRHSGEGSFATKACRARGLQQLADELHGLGFKLKSAKNLAPKHALALVRYWKGEGIADATIRNRLGWLRWWAEKVGNTASRSSRLNRSGSSLGDDHLPLNGANPWSSRWPNAINP